MYNGRLCIEKNTLKEIIENFLRMRIDYNAMINHLKNNKIIDCDNSGAASKKIMSDKKYLGRFIQLNVVNMENYLKNANGN